MARLTFHGAAQTVTGSKYLVEVDGARVLVDCGLFQGLKELRLRNWAPFPVSPQSIDAVVLTHAHIDHIGYLPRLVRDGFRGPVFATPATESLAELLLLDSAHNQEEEAAYANRKGYSKHKPALPLYDTGDAKRALRRFRSVHRDEWFHPAAPLRARYHDTGHLLGSCMVEIEWGQGDSQRRIVFSGDVGRYGAPLYHDPQPPPACDYLVCESTYGNREHPDVDILDQLCDVVQKSIRRGGVMLMASFAVGRAQQLIYLLQVLMDDGRIPNIPIVLDSPMAASGMEIYRYYASEHDLSEGLTVRPDFQFSFDRVRITRNVAESKAVNKMMGPGVIISSSGMMTGGRILHHLRQRLPDERNTIVLGGFMAAGTRGRALQEGAPTIRMFGSDVPVRAAVVEVSSLSAHAGHSELLRWLAPLPPPRRVFLTHGELSSSMALAEELHRTRGWDTLVPEHRQFVDLDADPEPER
ncbi:MAG: MBL fold metallo-hydrolase [Planctomycetota bacterium]|nr:MAG: MBL fold metallo-hydrolase [Planctomycetota bacterium]